MKKTLLALAVASAWAFLPTTKLDALGSEVILFTRGDANDDDVIDIDDVMFIADFLYSGGPAPSCEDAADTNDDGGLDLQDPVYLSNFLFKGGPPPASPFPGCGPDDTDDELSCEGSANCS